MKKWISAPKILLALLLIPAALWAATSGTLLDLHLHDTYFVFSPFSLSLLLMILVLAEALIYLLTQRFRQPSVLQYLHVLCVALFLIAVFFVFYYPAHGGNFAPDRYYEGNGKHAVVSDSNWWSIMSTIAFLAFVAGHLAFLIALIAGFVKGKKATL